VTQTEGHVTHSKGERDADRGTRKAQLGEFNANKGMRYVGGT